MPRLLLITVSVLVLILIIFGAFVTIVSAKPIAKPGNPFFVLQRAAEDIKRFTLNPNDQLAFEMKLVDRRIVDFIHLYETERELDSIQELDNQINLLLDALLGIRKENRHLYTRSLTESMNHIFVALLKIQNILTDRPEIYLALNYKVNKARMVIETGPPTDEQLLALINLPFGVLPAGVSNLIPVTGTNNFVHTATFPLTGQHIVVDCHDCHPDNQFGGNPTECNACHSMNLPANHFEINCGQCHSTDSWMTGYWLHPSEMVAECQSCHERILPHNHFVGICSACHQPTAWSKVIFDHKLSGAVDCVSCHLEQRPTNHYDAQCSACHALTNWAVVSFNHDAVEAIDCQFCHNDLRPINHYSGQCSYCHNNKGWLPATFNHQYAGAVDCISCHLAFKPTNHFEGLCSLCHTTTAWLPVNFDHSGVTDCLSCHLDSRPANHYTSQCSYCHTTSAWLPVNFNHSIAGAIDCKSCHLSIRPAVHYDFQCSMCHSTSAWTPAYFSHDGLIDCISCHQGTAPASHYDYQCSLCHTTDSWLPASFTHSFPLTHGDANQICSSCHPGVPPEYSCYGCHSKDEMEDEHHGMTITDDCVSCHPDGRIGR